MALLLSTSVFLPAENTPLANFAESDTWVSEAAGGLEWKSLANGAQLIAKRSSDQKRIPSDQDRGIYNAAGGGAKPGREAVLRLKRRPILPDETVRAGIWLFVEQPIAVAGFWLTFVDAAGRSFEYSLPNPQSWQKGWQYFDTFPFDANERGKLHPQVGRLVGGESDLPKLPLKFSGVRVLVQEDAEGKWILGQVEADNHHLAGKDFHWGLNIPGATYQTTQTLLRSGEAPYLLAGQILPEGGKADVSWEIRAGYQGAVVAHGHKDLSFTLGDAVAMAQRIPLGELPEGYYEVVLTRRFPDKDLVQQRFGLDILKSPVKSEVIENVPSSAEVGTALQIPTPYWFEQEGLKKWHIEDAEGQTVASGDFTTLPVVWTPAATGLYRYVGEREVDGKVVDRDVRMLGGKTGKDALGAPEFSNRDHVPSEADLFGKGRSYFTWSMYENHPDAPEYWDWCKQWIADGRAAGFELIRLRLDWGKIEKLPGVFDFTLTDRLIAEVARQGGKAILELRFEAPEWLPVSHQLDSYGRADIWNHDRLGRIPSIWTPGLMSSIEQFVRAAVLRYRNDPAVAGYHIWGLPGSLDWTTVDRPYWGQRLDYSPVAIESFQAWTKNKYATVPFASQDWSQPDLSPGWQDWVAFRRHGLDTFFLDTVLRPLRELDDRRSVVAYFGLDYASTDIADSARTLNWRRHTGGSELYYQTPLKANMALSDTGKTWPQEVHLLTPLPAGLELATFNVSSAGGDAFHWNYYWRNNIPVGKWTPEREEGLQEWQKVWRPLWEDLRDAQPADAPDVAGLMTWSTMHYGLRTFFPLRLGDYVTPTAAAAYRDGLWPDWFTENARLDNLGKYKLIIVPAGAAQVLPVRVADALATYVEEGGRLVLFPDSGKWIIEEQGAPEGLLNRVGGKGKVQPTINPAAVLDSGNSGLPASAQVSPAKIKPVDKSPVLSPETSVNLFPGLVMDEKSSTVEARFPDGNPALIRWSYGKGEVLLLGGTPEWPKSAGLLRDIYHWAGGQRAITTDRPDVQANHLRKGDAHYVILHRLTDSFRPQPPVLDRPQLRKQPSISTIWKLSGLAEGQWAVEEVSVDGRKSSVVDSKELGEGIATDLFLAQTKVFKLTPVHTSPQKK
jgi:hypothetical protein